MQYVLYMKLDTNNEGVNFIHFVVRDTNFHNSITAT